MALVTQQALHGPIETRRAADAHEGTHVVVEAVRDPLLVDVAVHVLYEGGLDFTEVAALLAPVAALITFRQKEFSRKSKRTSSLVYGCNSM